MKTIACSLLMVALPLAAGAKTWPEAALTAAKDINAFASALYGQLAARDDGNLFLSPYSISTALAMTYAGARGNTETQMAAVLRFGLGQDRLHPAYLALGSSLQFTAKEHRYELNIANRLWGQEDYPFLAGFLDTVEENYGAEVARADFVRDAVGARGEINRWVERQTKDRIKDLIAPRVLDALTRLVLVNAIYFKGFWDEQFRKKATQDEPFLAKGLEKKDVPMMHRAGSYRYAENEALQALELPYRGGGFSMVILLPRKPDGWKDLEASLRETPLDELLSTWSRRAVQVALPRFKAESSFRLDETLRAMGMTDAFTGGADFSGMSSLKDLFISAVIHKAFVDVNEEGTEAAAATAVVMSRKAAVLPQEAVVFRADHPFLFLIRDTASGCILFMGRLTDPGS